jgi:imidazolonepropionase-like amidohydrolase
MQALQTATLIPAKAMRADGEVGTSEVDKRADLLVSDANPLIKISKDPEPIARFEHEASRGLLSCHRS